jgi:hypothetical protein
MIESILLSTVQVKTMLGSRGLTNATGFFFETGGKLFLVSSRHVVLDEKSNHRPDRLNIEIHTDEENLAESVDLSIELYSAGQRLWRQGRDPAGDVDVAVIEVDRQKMPESAVFSAFTDDNLYTPEDDIRVGDNLLIVGFPLGFHDTLHHTPVARHAIIASSFGFRFQGEGYFLTDARTHRGSSGAPVVMRARNRGNEAGGLPWILVGIHSARLDLGGRNVHVDEGLGLNVAWYSDIITALTESAA